MECVVTLFQSTLPVGGATRGEEENGVDNGDFNPRSPWGERLTTNARYACALRFQSTLPVGGATGGGGGGNGAGKISIHAPRGGSDGLQLAQLLIVIVDFNPRSPWGERPIPALI